MAFARHLHDIKEVKIFFIKFSGNNFFFVELDDFFPLTLVLA